VENIAVKIQLITHSGLDFSWVQLYNLNFSTYTQFCWRERASPIRLNLEIRRCSCTSKRAARLFYNLYVFCQNSSIALRRLT